MRRVFEIQNPEEISQQVKKLWGIESKSYIGPINTNISTKCKNIDLIIVCESPSNDEIREGYPAAGSTGRGIFNNLVKIGKISSEEKYNYTNHYSLFEQSGIYLTNLVRFQADFNIKGDELNQTKNKRVKRAWEINKNFLFKEVKGAKENFGNVPVLIACGTSFENEVKELIKFLNDENMPWYVTSYPSRFQYEYSDNYNPETWYNDNSSKTVFCKKIIKKYRPTNQ